MKPNPASRNLFLYLLALTGFFVLIEISLVIQVSQLYLGDYKVVAEQMGIPIKSMRDVLYFLCAQTLIHLLYVILIWLVANCLGRVLRLPCKHVETMGLILWCLGLVTVLFANQVLLPNSKFSLLTGFFFSPRAAVILLEILLIIWIVPAAIAVYGLFRFMLKRFKLAITSILLIVVGVIISKNAVSIVSPKDASTETHPNIIIIGIDSVRPDFLSYLSGEERTPYLDGFLKESLFFKEAYTPLARTFPAWVSILSGQYPKNNGVRFNLALLSKFNFDNLLPVILKKEGYQTIFATDETRFSNIDQRFGFDEVLTPPIGFNDFLVGGMSDFPFSNLLVNTTVGKWLFPYSYANRPVYMTYDPDSFIDFLKPVLAKSRTKPLFLAVHFCLPHFPYSFGTQLAESEPALNYRLALSRVDQQFHDFLMLLNQNNLLKNTIVVVLSDHGEALSLAGDRVTDAELYVPDKPIPKFYPPSNDKEAVNQTIGHGTDVLGLSQYRVLLAFRFYGAFDNALPGRQIAGLVSLLDIKPTLLDFVRKHNPTIKNDGMSLKNTLIDSKLSISDDRDMFIESDFSPQAIRSVHPEMRNILLQGIHYFQIDPDTTRITVKSDMAKMILSSKQFAIIHHGWILALYPQSNGSMTPILVNLQNGLWTDDLQSEFAERSPAKGMRERLKRFLS